jgi:hypothetical protein
MGSACSSRHGISCCTPFSPLSSRFSTYRSVRISSTISHSRARIATHN